MKTRDGQRYYSTKDKNTNKIYFLNNNVKGKLEILSRNSFARHKNYRIYF